MAMRRAIPTALITVGHFPKSGTAIINKPAVKTEPTIIMPTKRISFNASLFVSAMASKGGGVH